MMYSLFRRWSCVVVVLGAAVATAGAQALPPTPLAEAEALYQQGRFDEAARRVEAAFGENLDVATTQAAYRLLILAHLQRGDRPAAELTLLQLFHVAPDYAPDPVQDPPAYVQLIEAMRVLLQPRTADERVCEAEMKEAEDHYVAGRFAESVAALQPCFAREMAAPYLTQAYRMLALAYLKQGAVDPAKQAVVRLLRVEPAYAPDPVFDPPAYTALVDLVRRQQ